MVDFAGWRLPVQYTSVVDEHRAVRTAAGLFDVSHMGEVRVSGPGAESFVQGVTPNDVAGLEPGQAHYSALLTEEGTYVDDLLVYKLGSDELLLVVNAANAAEDYAHLDRRAPDGVVVEDVSASYALLALQGPRAAAILAPLTAADLDALGYYRFVEAEVAGAPVLLSRTGYTGEDGFELYVSPERSCELWRGLLDAGGRYGLVPAGLGARDTLRLEAGMALYGHEIDRETNPWEAGLGWTIKLKSGPFVGSDALRRLKKEGPRRRLVGVELETRGPVPRQGHPLLIGGEEPVRVGEITSGTWSPTLEKGIGMAYVRIDRAEPGTELIMEVRGRKIPVVVRPLPFYRREN